MPCWRRSAWSFEPFWRLVDKLDMKGLTVITKVTDIAFCTVGNHFAVSIPHGHNCPECKPFPDFGYRLCLS